MTPEQFNEAILMLRSSDAETYEEGFAWFECEENLLRYIQKIASLLRSENDPCMRQHSLS